MHYYFCFSQMVSIIISVIYYGQKIDQDGVMNINGALFLLVTNMTFQNALAVINVRLPIFICLCTYLLPPQATRTPAQIRWKRLWTIYLPGAEPTMVKFSVAVMHHV